MNDVIGCDIERDPEATIRAFTNRARMKLLELATDRDRWDRLTELAIERSTTIGVREYGTGAWDKTPPELEGEGDDEIADWIFYTAVGEDVSA